ncbi:hypothetical protein HPP92_028589 [Vanilla planifolia]|uniref:Pollen Ole e 1 allergen and extensin family protein n=1 Tax=Vanilla planifolia TaxID=51239 RepID=A0A835U2D4_VANPL|nr:hypothetical protein HPP92_028589 [Vanilla planifolia]
MALAVLFFLLCASLFPQSLSLNPNPTSAKPKTNITVIGSVFCDPCSENTFSKHSYFLPGVQVLIQCRFAVRSKASDEITVRAERTTDGFGLYKLDIPQWKGFSASRVGNQVDVQRESRPELFEVL